MNSLKFHGAEAKGLGYKPRMYEARKICNFLLARYDAKRFNLTNLRINKLLYFIHVEGLRSRPEGLIRNHFEAWEFGPVVRPVFDTFKIHDKRPISSLATYLDYATGKNIPIPFSDIGPEDAELICRVFEEYSKYTTGQLVALSHESGGPWDVIYRTVSADKTASPRIPNELMRQHYILGKTSPVAQIH